MVAMFVNGSGRN